MFIYCCVLCLSAPNGHGKLFVWLPGLGFLHELGILIELLQGVVLDQAVVTALAGKLSASSMMQPPWCILLGAFCLVHPEMVHPCGASPMVHSPVISSMVILHGSTYTMAASMVHPGASACTSSRVYPTHGIVSMVHFSMVHHPWYILQSTSSMVYPV